MAKFYRMQLHESAEIDASAGEVWELLSDWAGMLRWWLSASAAGLGGPTLVGCTLVGEPVAVPRTRRMSLDNGVVVEEELFYQNDATRRLYYMRHEPVDSDLSGYVAAIYVDETEPDHCTVHISSSFDLRLQANSASAALRFQSVYRAIFKGIERYPFIKAGIVVSAAGEASREQASRDTDHPKL